MSAWKPKDKPLTLEEAVDLARKDLTPFWFGSEPLLAAIPAANKTIAYPLSPKLSENPWVLLFADPTNFSTEGTLLQAKEWARRYSRHGIHFLLCFRPPFQILRQPEWLANSLKKNPLPFITTLDAKGNLSAAFSVKEFPKVVLLNQGQLVFEEQGAGNIARFEASLQPFLRKTDPGLSFPPPRETPPTQRQDLGRMDFSDLKLYPPPGFKAAPNGVEVGKFAPASTATRGGKVFGISGMWAKVGERIITSDPDATITLSSSAAFISIFAQAGSTSDEPAEIEIELDNNPPYEAIRGQDLRLGEDGHASACIREPRVYHFVTKMPRQSREITLRFPTAKQCAVELFGILLGI